MKMHLKKYFTSIAMLLTTFAYTQNLKLVLVKGQKFEVITVTKINSVSEIMGQVKESNSDKISVQTINVKDSRYAETDLSITTTKLQISLVSNGQEIKYDSEKNDNPGIMVESFGKDVGKIKNITVDGSGKTVKEDKSVKDSGPSMNLMVEVLLTDGIPIFQSTFFGKEFIVNASWKDSVATNTEKMKIVTTGSFTIKNIENNIAIIVFTGIQKTTGVTEQMGQEFNITSTNKVNSEIKVNISTAIVMEKTSASDGITYIDAGGMLIPVTINSTSVSKTILL